MVRAGAVARSRAGSTSAICRCTTRTPTCASRRASTDCGCCMSPAAVVVHVEGATAGTDVESGHKRHQEQNRPKFVAKWRTLLEAEHLTPSADERAPRGQPSTRAARASDRPLACRCGIATLGRCGCCTSCRRYIALRRPGHASCPTTSAAIEPYTRDAAAHGRGGPLRRAGRQCASCATIGPRLTTVILSRPHPASRWLDAVREFAPSARWSPTTRSTCTGSERHVGRRSRARPRPRRRRATATLRACARAKGERAARARAGADARDGRDDRRQRVGARASRSATCREFATLLIPTVHDVDAEVLPGAGTQGRSVRRRLRAPAEH